MWVLEKCEFQKENQRQNLNVVKYIQGGQRTTHFVIILPFDSKYKFNDYTNYMYSYNNKLRKSSKLSKDQNF